MSLREGFTLTKIVATVGPACRDAAVFARMIDEGVRVARINFSHGDEREWVQAVAAVREACAAADAPVALLGDLQGPKIRLNKVDDEPLTVEPGDAVELYCDGRPGVRSGSDVVQCSTSYPPLADEVAEGHRVLIDDGAVRMLATGHFESEGRAVLRCNVTQGGALRTRKGVNLPDTRLSMPSMTERDDRCLKWATQQGFDFIALSFVRDDGDVRELRRRVRDLVPKQDERPGLIAKIETPEATRQIEAICEQTDALMVARGDLGVEMDVAEVPVLQKKIIKTAHDYGRPVIVATQMLQSMIESPSPTRAEVSDVANAILDGADAVMLSGETAVGSYPVQAVHVLTRVAREAEAYSGEVWQGLTRPPRRLQESRYRTAALAHGVSVIVKDMDAGLVAIWSSQGGTARYLSQNRLRVPVLGCSSSERAMRQMGLMFGVRPVRMDHPTHSEDFVHQLDALLRDRGWADPGDPVVIVKGDPIGTPGVTNQVQLHYVGDVCRVTWRAKGA